MVSKLQTLGLNGIEGYRISVECFISNGLPGFEIVGLPDAAVKEARERVRAAVKTSGFKFPPSRITVNLAPANTKKSGTVYDLPILMGILSAFGQESSLTHHINFGMLESDCCRAAFLRGAFLAGGSVNDPAKRYHLEFITGHAAVGREMMALMLEMNLAPRESSRGGGSVIYFKQSEAIEDVLTTMGAPLASMVFMQAKMQRSMNSAVNRKVNCDSANADKIVAAAAQQLDAIRELERLYGLTSLPDVLQETAMLRIANPEASLTDLAKLADPPVSKSCMGHRMKKLLEYKEE